MIVCRYKYQDHSLHEASRKLPWLLSFFSHLIASFLALSSQTREEESQPNLYHSSLSLSLSSSSISLPNMKLAASLNSKFLRLSPKRIFRSKSKASVSRSDPSSFSSNVSSSSSDGSYGNLKAGPSATPVSVLPENSGDWSQVSGDRDFYTELVQAFKLIDRDDDGVVSRGDLAALLSRLSPEPPSQEEVSLMLREVDGGRGDESCISLEELASRVAETSGEGSVEKEEMREVFEFFDADRNGKISAEELHRVFGVIGDERCTIEECQRMIATVDRNGDGFVCFEDFSRMMELQAPAMNDHH